MGLKQHATLLGLYVVVMLTLTFFLSRYGIRYGTYAIQTYRTDFLNKDEDSELEPMVLGLGYWEQTSNALKNLLDLQCWAKAANISKVVEPSITTGLGFRNEQSLKLGDLYNISEWNKMSVGQGFSSLESMEYFFKYAVKEVVYVHIQYAYDEVKCQQMRDISHQNWYNVLRREGFTFIKVVCIDYDKAPSQVMSDSSFRDLIFQGNHRVTVLFNEWRGVRGSSGRVALTGSKCIVCLNSLIGIEMSTNQSSEISYVPNSISAFFSSKKIDSYIDRFLSEHLSGGEYIAVMLRSEKIKKSKLLKFGNDSCASGIISDWKEMVGNKNITKTLFFSDIGRYGSAGWHDTAAIKFSQHIHDALHLHLALDKMNSILEGLTGSRDFGLMAGILHQQLVARATCVLVIGGGSFQAHTLNTYAHLHRGKECYVHRGGECEKYYFVNVLGQKLSV